MDDNSLLRYSRQVMLPDVDIAGQEKLLSSQVLIVGLGGLGSPAALYLAAAGVGYLKLCDHDQVDLSNLQRQIVHDTSSIGLNKAVSAANRISMINPTIEVEAITHRLDATSLNTLLSNVDLVVDCTDNYDTRSLINEYCWRLHIPVVSGAAIRFEGHVALFDPNTEDSPCYRCLYSQGDDDALNCAENGVISPLVGIVGACQAMEAIKYLTNIGTSLAGYVLYIDAKYADWRKLKLTPKANCPVCSVST